MTDDEKPYMKRKAHNAKRDQKNFEEINKHRWTFLRDIEVKGEDNRLKITIDIGSVGQPEEDQVLKEILGQTFHTSPIEIPKGNPAFQIVFDYYYAYQMMDEMYADYCDEEPRLGKRFRFYYTSPYLRYHWRSQTLPLTAEDYDFNAPGFVSFNAKTGLEEYNHLCNGHKMKHFRVFCEDQVIDVLSHCMPKILRLF